ncbi:hypothetical protein BDZ89DRAFT_1052003 [Hymenopellis radicata]|nr:hypothetical protein BDZ89DRAFT_1052003 [Hymenopellis radicata]
MPAYSVTLRTLPNSTAAQAANGTRTAAERGSDTLTLLDSPPSTLLDPVSNRPHPVSNTPHPVSDTPHTRQAPSSRLILPALRLIPRETILGRALSSHPRSRVLPPRTRLDYLLNPQGHLETSTSHRVTESSGDSTRVGHVGVRTRVTRESRTHESERESEYRANGPQRLENETCAIILLDPAIRAESRSDAQPVGCGFGIWLCAGPAAAGSAPVADPRTSRTTDHPWTVVARLQVGDDNTGARL